MVTFRMATQCSKEFPLYKKSGSRSCTEMLVKNVCSGSGRLNKGGTSEVSIDENAALSLLKGHTLMYACRFSCSSSRRLSASSLSACPKSTSGLLCEHFCRLGSFNEQYQLPHLIGCSFSLQCLLSHGKESHNLLPGHIESLPARRSHRCGLLVRSMFQIGQSYLVIYDR